MWPTIEPLQASPQVINCQNAAISSLPYSRHSRHSRHLRQADSDSTSSHFSVNCRQLVLPPFSFFDRGVQYADDRCVAMRETQPVDFEHV